eukprot:TRINITY_DN75653_c0_g1_i1.p1 TRINITY_DN75653_c0_g1~~TRINITY_DN75653_c0_g1_i1.p1  ORF type:complete len:194 (+),score=20.53 TRINITY_DN75653_c0_g1_i1:63-584(+)
MASILVKLLVTLVAGELMAYRLKNSVTNTRSSYYREDRYSYCVQFKEEDGVEPVGVFFWRVGGGQTNDGYCNYMVFYKNDKSADIWTKDMGSCTTEAIRSAGQVLPAGCLDLVQWGNQDKQAKACAIGILNRANVSHSKTIDVKYGWETLGHLADIDQISRASDFKCLPANFD